MRIETNQDDADSSLSGSNQKKYFRQRTDHKKHSFKFALLEFLPLVALVTIPFSVHAGVFSSIMSAISPVVVAENTQPAQSAVEIKLLSALINSDPKAALGGGDLIVEDGALVSPGPLGEDEYYDESYSSGEISVYVVREGDSLSQIAQMFDVTTNTILWANEIDDPKNIQPGDTLVILPIVGVRHVVKDGDTLSTIAKKYDGDMEEILSYNQLSSADALSVGDTVVVPGGNMDQAMPKKVAASVSPTKTSGSVTSSSGYFTHPLPGSTRTQGLHGYNAVDLAAPYGTPIRAAASGEVIVSRASGWNGGYGSYVVVRHPNGTQTLYAHTSSNIVGVGEYVTAGQTIAYVGSSGRSTGNHLHFEVRGASNPF